MRFNFLKTARELTDIAIKNSEIVKPYVKEKHYTRGLLALNALYYALRMADNEE